MAHSESTESKENREWQSSDRPPHSRSNDDLAWGQNDHISHPAGSHLVGENETAYTEAAAATREAADTTSQSEDDARARALAGYELDVSSSAQAARCGERAAQIFSPDQWRVADLSSRLSDFRTAEQVITDELSVERAPAVLDPGLTSEQDTMGWSDGERVVVAAWTVEADTPTDMLETLAHEYRHQWQQKVIDGDLVHPDGEAARAALADGKATYQTYDFDAYVDNALELDAEAFALTVSRGYRHALGGEDE